MMMSCRTANGTQALYYAWEGIVRGEGAVVNLRLIIRQPGWALGVGLLTLPRARRQATGAADSLRGSGMGVLMLSDEDQLAKNEAGWTGRSLAWYQYFGR